MSHAKPSSQSPTAVPPVPDAWRAVLERDARYDGRFVYAVTSTGIFCRPSCASRRPRRERVRFFPDPGAAERAGFRACKRCRPNAGRGDGPSPLVTRALAHLDTHRDHAVSLAELSAALGCSPYHLQRTFKRAIGISPREYQDALRKQRFTEHLRAGDTVSRATYEAGYGSSSRVYGRRDVRAGMTPATYRRRAAGKTIRFAIVGVPMGRLLVAFTDEGVCAVKLGDDDASLEQSLRDDFSHADIMRAPSARNDPWVAAVAELARGHTQARTVPLDVQGTAFQWKVWKALQRIPAGQTRSYAEVARRIGAPTAIRAVAGACARNPVALVVPCHRVVRSNGELGGYRWGVDRKAGLLERERRDGER
jgi:AraC family transcriptional regulator, regulatory protein of adaptative response / methylated-DNA-[protein]-cysteine methyltransferase